MTTTISLSGARTQDSARGAGDIRVDPASITITDLRPGTTGAVDVAVTNTSSTPAQVSVTGDLRASELAGEEDLLQVSLAGCTQPWAGVPTAPRAAHDAPGCPTGEVPASSGSLAAVPLEAGQTLHLLISAGLSESADNHAQGQTWTATFNVAAQSTAPPAALPLTGTDPSAASTAAAALIVAGALALRWRRPRTPKDTPR